MFCVPLAMALNSMCNPVGFRFSVTDTFFTNGKYLFLQIFVSGTVTTAVLKNLTPLTEYIVNVYALLEDQTSEPLKGTETTCECPLSFELSSYSIPEAVQLLLLIFFLVQVYCAVVYHIACWTSSL